MRSQIIGLVVSAALLFTPACVHTTIPLDVNFQNTPVMGSSSRGDIKKITYSSVDFEWGDNGVGEIAKHSGLERVYYIDIEEFSVLYWSQSWVHVYGVEAASAK